MTHKPSFDPPVFFSFADGRKHSATMREIEISEKCIFAKCTFS